MKIIKKYKIEIVLFVISLIVHSALFVAMVSVQGSVLDVVRVDDGYFELTENVLAGNGFSWSSEAPYEPNSLRTPGYIYILALLISVAGITGAAVIQLIASSLIPILGLKIAEIITKSKNIGIFTGVILALDPTLAFLSFQFYTDTVFILLFLPWLLVTLLYSKSPSTRMLIISAVILGIATLVRPVTQFIPFFMAIAIFWHFGRSGWKEAFVHVGVYFVIVGAILTPWIVRNVNTFDTPGLSSQSSFIIYTNLVPAVKSVANKTNFLEERAAFLTFEEYKGDAITLTNGDEYTAKAVEILSEHPTETVYVMSKALFTFFTNDGFYTLFARLGFEPRDFLLVIGTMKLMWILITLSAFVGALRYLFKNPTPWAFMMVFLIGYFALTSMVVGFGANPRYRLPVDPIILALASIGVLYAITWAEKFTLVQSIKERLKL